MPHSARSVRAIASLTLLLGSGWMLAPATEARPRKATTPPNLAATARARASFDKTVGYELATLVDGSFDTRWDGGTHDDPWVELAWERPVRFDHLHALEWNHHLTAVELWIPQRDEARGAGRGPASTSGPGAAGPQSSGAAAEPPSSWKAVGHARVHAALPVEQATRRLWELSCPTPIETDRLRLQLRGHAVSLYELRLALEADRVVEQAGTVRDARTHHPLAGAVVTALPWGNQAITDAAGHYALRLEPGQHVLAAQVPDATPPRPGAASRPTLAYRERTAAVHLDSPKPPACDLALEPVRTHAFMLEGVLSTSRFPKERSSSVAIPFDLPAGVSRLQLRLDDLQPVEAPTSGAPAKATTASEPARRGGRGNAIDFFYRWVNLALFDPHGVGPAGFRGLGMSRGSTSASISLAEATPGWIAGPLPAGHWTLLAHAGPDKVDMRYRISVRYEQEPTPAPTPHATYQPGVLSQAPGWFKGDFHNHTNHSADADQSLAAALADRRAQGWDWMALTDHNTVSGHHEVARIHGRQRPLVLLGEEVTSELGHFNLWGLPQGHWCDFRLQPGDDSLPRLIREVHRLGGMISLNHPGFPLLPPKGFDWVPGLDGVEVWNSADDNALARRLAWLDALYARGERIALRGGSDLHHPRQPHLPITWIRAHELSEAALMRGIRAGHMFVTRDARGPRLELTATSDRAEAAQAAGAATRGKGAPRLHGMMGDTLVVDRMADFKVKVSGAKGKLLRVITVRGVEQSYPIDRERWEQAFGSGQSAFVRIEVTDPSGTRYHALSNPVYLETPAR